MRNSIHDLDRFTELWNDGTHVDDIAREFGCSERLIYKFRDGNGLKPREVTRQPKTDRGRFSDKPMKRLMSEGEILAIYAGRRYDAVRYKSLDKPPKIGNNTDAGRAD